MQIGILTVRKIATDSLFSWWEELPSLLCDSSWFIPRQESRRNNLKPTQYIASSKWESLCLVHIADGQKQTVGLSRCRGQYCKDGSIATEMDDYSPPMVHSRILTLRGQGKKRNKVEKKHKKFIVGKARSVQGKSDKNWTSTYTDETNGTGHGWAS